MTRRRGGHGADRPRGVIHDLGYRRYDGPRLGRGAIIAALCWHSLRSAFGLGRGFKAKIVPFLLLAIMCLPAVVNAVALAVSPEQSRACSLRHLRVRHPGADHDHLSRRSGARAGLP